ncbi:MAG: hypothetical protein H6975_07760 [Gammaproteobacteria bacterium]|nr:hypothetical protein [Gammaproteobacteria bacterium]
MNPANSTPNSLQNAAIQAVDTLSDLQQRLAAIMLTESLDESIFTSLIKIESCLASVRGALHDACRNSAGQEWYRETELLARFRALPDHVMARILVGLIDGDFTYQEQLAILIPDRADKSAKMAGLRHIAGVAS